MRDVRGPGWVETRLIGHKIHPHNLQTTVPLFEPICRATVPPSGGDADVQPVDSQERFIVNYISHALFMDALYISSTNPVRSLE